MGDGTQVEVLEWGCFHEEYIDNLGNKLPLILTNTAYIPSFKYNMFSLTQAMDKSFTISNNMRQITINNGKITIKFNSPIESTKGFVLSTEILPSNINIKTKNELSLLSQDYSHLIDVNIFHQRMGHLYESRLRKTAETKNIQLTGTLHECEACLLVKAKRKSV